jgi:hypothetical protein
MPSTYPIFSKQVQRQKRRPYNFGSQQTPDKWFEARIGARKKYNPPATVAAIQDACELDFKIPTYDEFDYEPPSNF